MNFSEAELMQYRWPVGWGPSLKRCPRWASLPFDRTSMRTIPCETSFFSTTESLFKGWKKLGQPLPDSNFVVEAKSASPLITST